MFDCSQSYSNLWRRGSWNFLRLASAHWMWSSMASSLSPAARPWSLYLSMNALLFSSISVSLGPASHLRQLFLTQELFRVLTVIKTALSSRSISACSLFLFANKTRMFEKALFAIMSRSLASPRQRTLISWTLNIFWLNEGGCWTVELFNSSLLNSKYIPLHAILGMPPLHIHLGLSSFLFPVQLKLVILYYNLLIYILCWHFSKIHCFIWFNEA